MWARQQPFAAPHNLDAAPRSKSPAYSPQCVRNDCRPRPPRIPRTRRHRTPSGNLTTCARHCRLLLPDRPGQDVIVAQQTHAHTLCTQRPTPDKPWPPIFLAGERRVLSSARCGRRGPILRGSALGQAQQGSRVAGFRGAHGCVKWQVGMTQSMAFPELHRWRRHHEPCCTNDSLETV